MSEEVTIYHIASALNISAATVSRALRDHPAISKATKKKIKDFAEKSGYRSNAFAANLRNKKTKTIGVIMHELNSHFCVEVLWGIEKAAAEEGYDILITHSNESAKKEIANANNLFHKRVDGILVSLAYDTEDISHFNPFFEKGIPVVFFDRVPDITKGIKITIDNFKAGYAVTEHLIKQGYKRIFHATASLKRNVYNERLKGYKKALADYKIKYDAQLFWTGDFTDDSGISIAKKILAASPKPDAAFITNDFAAAVCMQHLKDAGIKIPKQIAIAGFNNDVVCEIVEPKLTTINYPGKIIGEKAAQALLQQLNGTPTSKKNIVIDADIIVRGSSIK